MDTSMIFLNACKNNQKGVVQAFIKKGGIDFNKRDPLGNTALFYSCMKGSRDIAKLLLENGADASLANNSSISPLHAVSKSGNKEIISLLLEAGADINVTDKEGKTPLMYSLAEKRTETAKYLLEKGADIHIADSDGHKAVDYATAYGLRDILSDLSATESKNNFGNSPLHQACYNEQTEVVRELLKKENPDLNAVNDEGNTPLIIATIRGNLMIAKLLLEAGANPKQRLLNGNTSLHFAAEWGNQYIGKALLEAGAEIDAQNEVGETALLVAAAEGRNEFVNLLIENGANVNLVDNAQNSPLFYASEKGYTEIVEALIIAGAE